MRPCAYYNGWPGNFLAIPLGCYEESRFNFHEELVRQIIPGSDPPPFSGSNE